MKRREQTSQKRQEHSSAKEPEPSVVTAIEASPAAQSKGANEKENIYYSTMINAWINTRMERDKSVLTLSAAGVGLLVSLLTSVGASSGFEIIFYIFSFIGFLVATFSALYIFKLNADYVENDLSLIEMEKRREEQKDRIEDK